MKVKRMEDLHAMERSGAVKGVEGVKFVEPKKEEAPSAPQPAAPVSLEPLVAALKQSMERSSSDAKASAQAIYSLVLALSKNPAEGSKPRRWVFTVERDDDGFMEKITAEAVET